MGSGSVATQVAEELSVIPDQIGSYRIIRRIGQGSMGVVYQARDVLHDRDVAVKVMLPEIIADDGARLRFTREARAAASLRHRNIVAVLDFDEHADAPYIAMELLRGISLAERLSSGAPMSLGTKLDIIVQLCEGLQFAHDHGVVHRDVKPANIRLLDDGGVKLLDFGIASIGGASFTQHGTMVGSGSYMAPEQLSGDRVDRRADIFAAGVVLYELVAGRRPFEADTVTGVMNKILHEPPAELRYFAPDCPDDLVSAIQTALQKDPVLRYQQASDFGVDLRVLRHLPDAGLTPPIVVPAHDSGATPRPRSVSPSLPPTPTTGGFAGAPLPAASPTTASVAAVSGPVTTAPFDTTIRARPELPAVPSPVPVAARRLWLVGAGVMAALACAAIIWALLPRSAPPRDYTFELTSDPPGAAIIVDGVATGLATPATITRRTRPERLALAMEGFDPFSAPFDALKPGHPVKLFRTAPPPPPKPPGPAPAPSPSSMTVRIKSPDYPVQVQGCSTQSAAARDHRLTVRVPCTLELFHPEFILGRSVRIGATGPVEVTAPPVVTEAQLRSSAHAPCVVAIRGKDTGSPPVTVTIAVGEHPFTITCFDNRTNKHVSGTLVITAGKFIYDLTTFIYTR